MNVLSFNVLCRDWAPRVPLVTDVIRAEAPDVFGLQEAHADWMDAVCAAFSDYDYVGIGRNDGKRDGEFSAVFYQKDRFTLLDSGHFWLSETPDVPGKGWDAACIRICSWAKLEDKTNGKRFAVMNTHLDHRGAVAAEQGMALILERAAQFGDLPVLLTGDFNSFPESAPCRRAMDAGFADARAVAPVRDDLYTFHNFGDPNDNAFQKIIDYIFVKNCKSVESFRVVTDRPDGFLPSDHYPVFAAVNI